MSTIANTPASTKSKAVFLVLFLALIYAVSLALTIAPAHAATLLPNGKQTFVDANGVPYAGGSVSFYIPSTTTPKATYQDSGSVVLNTNPVILDAAGRAIIYGSGVYRQILKDAAGNTVWDQITADDSANGATSWGGTSAGSGNAQTINATGFTQLDGQTVAFIAGTTNTGAATLQVSGGAIIPFRKDTSLGPQVLTGGEIVAGNVVLAVYDLTANVFHLVGAPQTTPTFSTLTVSGATTLSGPVNLTNTISTTVSGSQIDWNPTGLSNATLVQVTGSSSPVITGMAAQSPGRVIVILNTGATAVRILPNSTSSIAANRFALGTPVLLQQNEAASFIYNGTTGNWAPLGSPKTDLVGSVFTGLKVQTTSSVAGTVSANSLTVSSAVNGGQSYMLSNVSNTFDITVAGAGGLDTGTETLSTWYYVFIIYNPATGTTNSLLSISSTGPTLPAGFTLFARVGAVRNDASSNLWRTIQYGRRVQIATGTNPTIPVAMATGSSGSVSVPTWTAVAVGAFVPPTATTIRGVLNYNQTNNTGAQTAPNNTYGAWNSSTNPPPVSGNNNGITGSNIQSNAQFEFTLESSNIYYASNNTGAGLFDAGWEDNL